MLVNLMPSSITIPKQPLPRWRINRIVPVSANLLGPLPVLFGHPGLDMDKGRLRCNIDIFGSIFFMLSRCEEVVLADRDVHNRFPGSASLAGKAGFLERPIVDEYVELLWSLIKQFAPNLKRDRRHGQVQVTCDVDTPFDCTASSGLWFLRSLAGDIVKRRDMRAARRRIRRFRNHRRGDHRHDDNYSFDWYMDKCEQHGRRAAFFFIPDRSAGNRDGCYKLTDSAIQELIRKIAARGHEIGTHGSYNSYRDGKRVVRELDRLKKACRRAGIGTDVEGNRQHYLRWDTMETPDHLDGAGYVYDTTGGFADAPGFRFGTSRPFPLWSWQKRAPLRIIQRPLVFMETTLRSSEYMGKPGSLNCLELSLKLKNRAMRYGGDFTMLWHNSNLQTAEDREFFEELIR
jgi:peptidoglycan/xylan/chitin deacetylase (PgdA/CDA1 family)